MDKHEEYFYRTLYSIVLISENGGQTMNSFTTEEKALVESEELIAALKESERTGCRVYLSELDYDHRKNRIMSDNILTDESKLLYES